MATRALPRLEDLATTNHGERVDRAVARNRRRWRRERIREKQSSRRPVSRPASARAWSSRSTCGPGPPAGRSNRSRSRGRSRRRPGARGLAWAHRKIHRPACRSRGCWYGRRCGNYGSSSSRRETAWRCRTAARPGRRRSARAVGPGEIVARRCPDPISTTEIVSSNVSATYTNDPSGLGATAVGRRPTTIRRGPCSGLAVIATSSTPASATIRLPRTSKASAAGSPAA